MSDYGEFQAKPYFEYLLKEYLHPLFKEHGYKKSGVRTWVRKTEKVEAAVTLRKSCYSNSKGIIFWFIIGVVNREAGLGIVDYSNDLFLPRVRSDYKRANHHWNGTYLIYREREFGKLWNDELKVDLEEYILPLLDRIDTKAALARIIAKKEEIEAEKGGGARWSIPDELSFDRLPRK